MLTQVQALEDAGAGTWATAAWSPLKPVSYDCVPWASSVPLIHAVPQFSAGLRSDSAPSFLLPHYKVPLCSAAREMKASLTGFAELEPHVCFPSVTYFFYNTTPFSYMLFHLLYTKNWIKIYSIFSPISHFKIYSNLMLLQCHVRKHMKFIFISLSYKAVCSNRDAFLFQIPRVFLLFLIPITLDWLPFFCVFDLVHGGLMRSFLHNVITLTHLNLDIKAAQLFQPPYLIHRSPEDASAVTGPSQNSALWGCSHSLLPAQAEWGLNEGLMPNKTRVGNSLIAG